MTKVTNVTARPLQPQVVVMQKGVKNLHFRPISHYISEILQARALVTTEDE